MGNIVDFFDRHYKAMVFSTAVILAVLLISVIIAFARRDAETNSYVVFNFAPYSAVLNIEGNEYRNGSYKFGVGDYSGTLSARGFETKTISFSVKNNETSNVVNYLINESEGLSYFEKNSTDIQTLRMIKGDISVTDFLMEYDEKIAIYEKLPLYASFDNRAESGFPGQDLVEVKITDGRMHADCDTTLCLLVSGRKIKQSKVVEVLDNNGFDINNYRVIYNYEN